jgi:hypothetical protein
MFSKQSLLILTTAAALLGAGCARNYQSAGGDIEAIDPVAAAQTVVLQANNRGDSAMELRIVASGQSRFIGSVGPRDSTAILLDRSIFPTAELYVVAIPADGRGRAISGPLAAARGDRIRFTIEPSLEGSRAIVVR